jgi:hypothetical protein
VYGHLKLYCLFVLECYAWYIHGTMVGRRAETGATLSANHVYPVGGVAHEAHRWHSYALSQSGTNRRPCTREVDIMKVEVQIVENLVNPPWFDCLCILQLFYFYCHLVCTRERREDLLPDRLMI